MESSSIQTQSKTLATALQTYHPNARGEYTRRTRGPHFASRLAADHTALARLWLERLDQLLDVEKRDVFPSHQLLDHIPELLNEIASYLRAPAEQEIAELARRTMREHPDVGAIVLECANFSPFSGLVRHITGLPVFDLHTLGLHACATTDGGPGDR